MKISLPSLFKRNHLVTAAMEAVKEKLREAREDVEKYEYRLKGAKRRVELAQEALEAFEKVAGVL